MSKRVLACDMDEILFPFLVNFIEHHNGKYGTSHKFDEFSSYEFENILGLEFNETVRRVYEFNAKDILHIDPIEDSVDAVKRLASKFNLEIITARHPKHKKTTIAWIEQYYGNIFRGIEFIGHPGVVKNPRTKAEVCKEINAVALIDDSLDHTRIAAAHDVEGILFGEYPWNQCDELPKGVVMKRNWREVLEYFNA